MTEQVREKVSPAVGVPPGGEISTLGGGAEEWMEEQEFITIHQLYKTGSKYIDLDGSESIIISIAMVPRIVYSG